MKYAAQFRDMHTAGRVLAVCKTRTGACRLLQHINAQESLCGLDFDSVAHVTEQNPDFDSWAEIELMENAQCNGRLDNWIFESNPEALNRLANINDYLNKREGR